MRSKYLAACALAALAACDGGSANPFDPAGAPAMAVTAPQWTIYPGTPEPPEVLDAPGGWEVGTGFRTAKDGRVIGFRFYRAPGETGSNYGKLYSPTGERLKLSKAFPAGTGWVTLMLDNPVYIQAGKDYRVAVNTNTQQVKKFNGYATDGPLANGPLTSAAGFYGQPTGSRPTTQSASYFYVDVIFEETVPVLRPDLYVGGINPYDRANVQITLCNGGTGDAGASTTQFSHWLAPLSGGPGSWKPAVFISFPAIPANTCATRSMPSASLSGYHNEYHVWADVHNVVDESDETNNYGKGWWQP